LELLKINDVTLDGSISFLWWSWVGWLGHDGRSTRVLTSIGQSEGSSKFWTADSLRISVVSTSFTIADVEWGDSISIRLSGVVVMSVAEYITVGWLTTWRGYRHRCCFIGWKWYFAGGGSGGGDLAGVTGAKRYSEVRSLGRLAVTTFLTGEKSRASPEGSARKTFLGGFRSTPLCSQAS
jgi:hypothetical protein